ncbi:hypothetical protein QR680_006918 [Steinernema hermaphroditum]|uniref:C2H2-type domain-containing protein n=1 Tax=Steinernema hermaphroditum TaxID=289476 RepID=A0AA39HY56_9BILA|nr:hypothetical protein QR680_006918 [Steinernema hermaphroditum]
MVEYHSWLEKAKMNGTGVDRDIEQIDHGMSDEGELTKTGSAPAIMSDEEDDSFSGSNLKNDLPPRKQAKRMSELLCLWQCAVCGKKIKGNWNHRRQHIGSHEKLSVPCPIAKCTSEPLASSFRQHLKLHHKTTMQTLSTEQKADVRAQLDRNLATSIQCEMKYFPSSNLVSSSETTGKNPVSPYCKKCGSRVILLDDRRNHVAVHLNLKISCPLFGCSYTGRSQRCMKHFIKKHGMKYSELRLQENQKFKKARKEFYAKVDLVMSEYFT